MNTIFEIAILYDVAALCAAGFFWGVGLTPASPGGRLGGAVEEKLEGGEKTVGGVGEIRGGLDGKVRTVRGKTNERKGTEERDIMRNGGGLEM